MYNLVKQKKMAINKVDLTVSQLINDLNSGLTWLKKDDLGYGSIEAKYGANPMQIGAIRKHPSLKDAETNITIFNIIDDTKNETTTPTIEPTPSRSSNTVAEQEVVCLEPQNKSLESAADVFANL